MYISFQVNHCDTPLSQWSATVSFPADSQVSSDREGKQFELTAWPGNLSIPICPSLRVYIAYPPKAPQTY